ncbi:MAG TPA: cell division protein FtsZ, partial [Bacteroidia bacterium]|nr:cell division protein FtsZ [Bacteroidia bacterium]
SNEKVRQIYGNQPISEAFGHADDILTTAAKGIAEIITRPGHINVDFEDVNTVMRNSGVAILGTASAEGDHRAKNAVVNALNSPLLEENDIRGAQHILLNISYGSKEITMDEVYEITEHVQEEAGYGTDIIWGNCYDERLGDKINVTIIATGFEQNFGIVKPAIKQKEEIKVALDEEKPKASSLNEVFDIQDATANAKTVDFDDFGIKTHFEEPYIKAEVKNEVPNAHNNREEFGSNSEPRKMRFESAQERSDNTRKMRFQLHQMRNTSDMENQPAYLRRNIVLDDVPSSRENTMSRFTLSADDEPQIRENNSFLYDNVD